MKKTVYQLILEQLREEFEHNGRSPNTQYSDANIWVMTVAVLPFSEDSIAAPFLPYTPFSVLDQDLNSEDIKKRQYYIQDGFPTHIVRLVLRTSYPSGVSEYVDGTDIYMTVNQEEQFADSRIWCDTWIDGPPKYHGGTIPDAMSWIRLMYNPFYIQLKDPFTLKSNNDSSGDFGRLDSENFS
jgi:hypothetical protein